MNQAYRLILQKALVVLLVFDYLLFEHFTQKLRIPNWVAIIAGLESQKWSHLIQAILMLSLCVLALFSLYRFRNPIRKRIRLVSLSLMGAHLVYILAISRFQRDYWHALLFGFAAFLLWLLSRGNASDKLR